MGFALDQTIPKKSTHLEWCFSWPRGFNEFRLSVLPTILKNRNFAHLPGAEGYCHSLGRALCWHQRTEAGHWSEETVEEVPDLRMHVSRKKAYSSLVIFLIPSPAFAKDLHSCLRWQNCWNVWSTTCWPPAITKSTGLAFWAWKPLLF